MPNITDDNENKDKTENTEEIKKTETEINKEPIIETETASIKKPFYKRLSFIITAVVLILLFITYIVPVSYFEYHFFTNTTINDEDFSYLDTLDGEHKLSEEIENYQLTITGRNGITDVVNSSDIDLVLCNSNEIHMLLENQNEFLWFIEIFKNHNYSLQKTIKYDDDKLNIAISKLSFYLEGNLVYPKKAYISDYDVSTGCYHIVEEEYGTVLKNGVIKKNIVEAINSLNSNIDLEQLNCYRNPTITSDFKDMIKAVDKMNCYVSTKITYSFGSQQEVLDGSIINEWINVNGFNVTLDQEQIQAYVKKLALNYDTYGSKRTFITTEGKTKILPGGVIGWKTDREGETEAVIELIQSGTTQTREPLYSYEGITRGEINDLGDTYVEINLSLQHLYVYVEGEIVLESDFVSGDVQTGCTTPEGIYAIRGKTTEVVLRGSMDNGDSWETPVHYWIPFNRGIGLHDATWRKKFGGEIYLTNGSHGCINLPYTNAAKIYEIVYAGMPVICYYDIVVQEPVVEETVPTTDTENVEKTYQLRNLNMCSKVK